MKYVRIIGAMVALITLGSMNSARTRVWSLHIAPLNDTLVIGVNNKMEIWMNGEPTGNAQFTITGASAIPSTGYTFIVSPGYYLPHDHATVKVTFKSKVVLEKVLPFVKNEGDIKLRVEQILNQK